MRTGNRLLAGVGVLVLLIAAGVAAADFYAQRAAKRAVDQLIAGLPPDMSARYDGLHYNLFTATLRLDGLHAARAGTPVLDVATLLLRHLEGAGTSASPFRVGALRATGIVMRAHNGQTRIDQLDARALAALAADATAAPPRWATLPGVGTLIAAGGIDLRGIHGKDGETIAHLRLTQAEGPHLGGLLAEAYRDNRLRFARLVARDLRLDTLDALFDPAAGAAAAPQTAAPQTAAPQMGAERPLVPLVGRLELTGAAIDRIGSQPRLAVQTDRLVLERLRIRPLGAPAAPSDLQTWAFLARLTQAIGFDELSVDGLRVEPLAPATGALALGKLDVRHFDAGRLDGASFDRLAMSDPGRHMALAFDHLALHWGVVAPRSPAAEAGQSPAPDGPTEPGSLRLGSADLSRLSLTLADGTPLRLDALHERVRYDGDAIVNRASLRGLMIPVRGGFPRGAAVVVSALGVDPLILDASTDVTWNSAARSLTIGQDSVSLRSLGTLHCRGDFGNVAPDAFSNQAAMQAALPGMLVRHLVLSWDDASLTNRLVALWGQMRGEGPEQARQEIIARVGAAGALLPDQPDATQQLARFLARPKVLTLTLTPPQPITLAAVSAAPPAARAALLGAHLSGD